MLVKAASLATRRKYFGRPAICGLTMFNVGTRGTPVAASAGVESVGAGMVAGGAATEWKCTGALQPPVSASASERTRQ